MIKKLLLASLLLTMTMTAENRVFEQRIYTTKEGKLDDLLKRFRDHTTKLFEKHGMTNIGYWVPTERAEIQKHADLHSGLSKPRGS